jgi:hypothetical protein
MPVATVSPAKSARSPGSKMGGVNVTCAICSTVCSIPCDGGNYRILPSPAVAVTTRRRRSSAAKRYQILAAQSFACAWSNWYTALALREHAPA